MKFGKQFTNELRAALLDAFPALYREEFALVVENAALADRTRTYSYDDLASGVVLYEMAIQRVIEWADAAEQLGKVLRAALDRRPEDAKLLTLWSKMEPVVEPFLSVGVDRNGLERVVLKGVSFEHVLEWVPRIVQARNAVCRFEPQEPQPAGSRLSDVGYGTAFLVAPDVVMTNDHNIVEYWGAQKSAARLAFRFDCYRLPDGTVTPGKRHFLATDWQILRSSADEYDFALVRLATRAGDDLVEGRARGFLELTPVALNRDDPLFILQHPAVEEPAGLGVWRAQPMMLSFGAVDRMVSSGRVAYRVNTNPGSSGSPCLTQDLRAVAIHHRGPNDDNNQAVLFQAICAHLQTKKSDLMAAGLGRLIGLDTPNGAEIVRGAAPDPQPKPNTFVPTVDLTDVEVLLLVTAALKDLEDHLGRGGESEIRVALGGGRVLAAVLNRTALAVKSLAQRLSLSADLVQLLDQRIGFLERQKLQSISVAWDMQPEINEKTKQRANEIGQIRQALQYATIRYWIET